MLVRLLQPRRYAVVSVWLLCIVGAVWMALAWTLGGLRGWILINSLLWFGSLWVFYMEFSFIILRSVSIRTMVELAATPGQRLAAEELERRYGTDTMFDQRIESLVDNGYLRDHDGSLSLTSRGRWLASAFELVRRILNMHAYG